MPTPRRDEVLVRVRAASVHPDVWHVIEALPYVVRFFGNAIGHAHFGRATGRNGGREERVVGRIVVTPAR